MNTAVGRNSDKTASNMRVMVWLYESVLFQSAFLVLQQRTGVCSTVLG